MIVVWCEAVYAVRIESVPRKGHSGRARREVHLGSKVDEARKADVAQNSDLVVSHSGGDHVRPAVPINVRDCDGPQAAAQGGKSIEIVEGDRTGTAGIDKDYDCIRRSRE